MILSTALLPRLRASGIHLGLSAPVALAALAVVHIVWYPPPLAALQGASRVVLMLIAAALCGPLLTLIVYDRSKKLLKLDLSIIAGLQIAAFLFGLHALFIARPAYLVFNVDRFDVVPARDVDRDSLTRARNAGAPAMPSGRPRTVAAELPADSEQRNQILFSALGGGADLAQRPEWYVPYEQTREQALSRLRPIAELREQNALDETQWREFLQQLDRDETDLAYLPLRGRVHDGAVIVDRATAEILRITALQPNW